MRSCSARLQDGVEGLRAGWDADGRELCVVCGHLMGSAMQVKEFLATDFLDWFMTVFHHIADHIVLKPSQGVRTLRSRVHASGRSPCGVTLTLWTRAGSC